MMWHRMHSFRLSTLAQTTVPNRLKHHSATITCLLDSIANDRLSDNFIVRRLCFVDFFSSCSASVLVIVSYCIVGERIQCLVCLAYFGSVSLISLPFVIKSRIFILSSTLYASSVRAQWDRRQGAKKIHLIIIYYGCGGCRETRIW